MVASRNILALAFVLLATTVSICQRPSRIMVQSRPVFAAKEVSPVEEVEFDCSKPLSAYGREACRLMVAMLENQQRGGGGGGTSVDRLYGKRFSEPYYGDHLLTKLTNSVRQSQADKSADLINQLLSSSEAGYSGFGDDMSHARSFNPMRGKRNNRSVLD